MLLKNHFNVQIILSEKMGENASDIKIKEEGCIKEEICPESAVEEQSLVYVQEGELKVELLEIKGESSFLKFMVKGTLKHKFISFKKNLFYTFNLLSLKGHGYFQATLNLKKAMPGLQRYP